MSPAMGDAARVGALEAATYLKVQTGCNFVNAEVSRLRRRVTNVGIAAAAGAVVLWLAMGRGDPRLPLFLAVLAITFVANRARRELASSYKGIVVRRMVAALGRGLSYRPASSLTQSEFITMDLFRESPHSWKSEDEVSGRKNDVAYALHEVLAKRRERSRRAGAWSPALALAVSGVRSGFGSVRDDDRDAIIFRGVIVKLDFNKNFSGHTVIVPQKESGILGGLFGESESRRSKAIVRLENPDFENMFSVYSTDDQEARYLITPKLMELVIRARILLGGELRLCFIRNALYVTVPQQKDRFEVALFGPPVTPETALGDLLECVNLAERLVDALDLETRIWTRV